MKKISVIFFVMFIAATATSWSQQNVPFNISIVTDMNTEREATGLAGLSVVIDQSSPAIGCGVPVTLTATITGANGISWMRNGESINGATTDTFIANQSGTYAVVVVSNLCQFESAPVEVILQSPLNAVVESPAGLEACVGDSVLLHAGGGTAAWQWTRNGVAIDGAVESVYLAFESGNYAVIGNEGEICSSASPEAGVIIHPLPNVSLAWAGNPTICYGDSLELSAALQYDQQVQWYLDETLINGVGSSVYWVGTSGEYHGMVMDTITGCSSFTNSLFLEVLAPQTVVVDISGPVSFCEGQEVVLSVSQGEGTIQWYHNGIELESAGDVVLLVDSAGTYEARLTDATGCASPSQAVNITLFELPNASIGSNGGPMFLCGMETLLLQVEEGNSYAWYNNDSLIEGAIFNQLLVSAAGVYTAQITNTSGCVTFSQAVDIPAFDAPQVVLEPSGNINICAGQSQFFDAQATSAIQYTWYLNGDVYSVDVVSVLETLEPGIWSVGITDENECSAMSDAAVLSILQLDIPAISDGGLNAEGQLLVTDDAAGHQWYLNGEMITSATGSSYLATQEGVYSVIVIEDVCESTPSEGFQVVLWGIQETGFGLGVYPTHATITLFSRTLPCLELFIRCTIVRVRRY